MTALKDPVLEVWEWCQESYLQQGIKLNLPTNTDPIKTYQYRYARQITAQFAIWGLDATAARRFLELAVIYAKEHNLLHKGLALFCQKNLTAVIKAQLEQDRQNICRTCETLAETRAWMEATAGTQMPVAIMLRRTNPDSYCNLVNWYLARRIPDLYLTLSANCGQALQRLSTRERALLPDQGQLYLLRLSFLQKEANRQAAFRIMKGDWRQCL